MGNDIGINSYTLAVITTDKNMSTSGGCPVFYANNDDDLQTKALLVAKSMDGMVHQISEEVLIVVRH